MLTNKLIKQIRLPKPRIAWFQDQVHQANILFRGNWKFRPNLVVKAGCALPVVY